MISPRIGIMGPPCKNSRPAAGWRSPGWRPLRYATAGAVGSPAPRERGRDLPGASPQRAIGACISAHPIGGGRCPLHTHRPSARPAGSLLRRFLSVLSDIHHLNVWSTYPDGTIVE